MDWAKTNRINIRVKEKSLGASFDSKYSLHSSIRRTSDTVCKRSEASKAAKYGAPLKVAVWERIHVLCLRIRNVKVQFLINFLISNVYI